MYQSDASRLVIRASRQVEKSTFLVNSIIYLAVCYPGIHIVCVFPRQEQARVFSSSRLLGTIEGSPVIRRVLLRKKGRKPQVMNQRFANGSEVYVRAAYHTADAVRGLDADVLIVDEFQDIAAGWAARHRRDAQPLADLQVDSDRHPEIDRQPSRGGLFPVDGLRMAGSVSGVPDPGDPRRVVYRPGFLDVPQMPAADRPTAGPVVASQSAIGVGRRLLDQPPDGPLGDSSGIAS